MQKTTIYRPYPTQNRQRGITMMPAIAAVALLTIITVLEDIPEQQQQRQQQQTTANTNTAVQLISATLSYYNDNTDANGNHQWPSNLSTDLVPYLPIAPPNIGQIDSISPDNTVATILFNMQTNANANRLAWQFSTLDIDIVDAAGNSNNQGTRVKVQLDGQRYGQWDFNNQAWSACVNGRAQRTAIDCKKDGLPHNLCLGSKVKTASCMKNIYGPCINGTQTRTCSSGIQNGSYQNCPSTPVTVSCRHASWSSSWGEWDKHGLLYKWRHRNSICNNNGWLNEKQSSNCDNSKKPPPKTELCMWWFFWWDCNITDGLRVY